MYKTDCQCIRVRSPKKRRNISDSEIGLVKYLFPYLSVDLPLWTTIVIQKAVFYLVTTCYVPYFMSSLQQLFTSFTNKVNFVDEFLIYLLFMLKGLFMLLNVFFPFLPSLNESNGAGFLFWIFIVNFRFEVLWDRKSSFKNKIGMWVYAQVTTKTQKS